MRNRGPIRTALGLSSQKWVRTSTEVDANKFGFHQPESVFRSWPAMPTRSLPKNSRSVTGRIASIKLLRAAEFESTLERDLRTLLKFDP